MKMSPDQILTRIKPYLTARNALFMLFAAVAFVLAFAPIKAFYATPMGGYYTHIALIPLVSLYLLFLRRKDILRHQKYCATVGLPIMLAGLLLFFGSRTQGIDFDDNNTAALVALSVSSSSMARLF